MDDQAIKAANKKQIKDLVAASTKLGGKLKTVFKPGTPQGKRTLVISLGALQKSIEQMNCEVCIEFRDKREPNNVLFIVWYKPGKGVTALTSEGQDKDAVSMSDQFQVFLNALKSSVQGAAPALEETSEA